MFDRFPGEAKRALKFSREAGLRHGHDVIDTEHLLLGLLDVRGGASTRVADEFCGGSAAVREAVQKHIKPGTSASQGQIPFTPQAKRALEFVFHEAMSPAKQRPISLRLAPIIDGDVLLGLLQEPNGIAGRVLRELGLTTELAREFLDAPE